MMSDFQYDVSMKARDMAYEEHNKDFDELTIKQQVKLMDKAEETIMNGYILAAESLEDRL